MKIVTRNIDDITIVVIDGMITLGSDVELSSMFEEQLALGRNKLILDMTKVKYIDSLGIGQLAGGYTSISERGGELVLARANEKIETLLKITGLQKNIRTFETVADALEAL